MHHMDRSIIDIIIVNYNSTSYLIDCLHSIYQTHEDLAINIFVTDNSTNNDIIPLKKIFPQIQLTRNKKNLGFAAGTNQGIRRSCSKYILLLNPDTIVLDRFFGPIIDYMESYPDVGIAGPKILNSDGKVQGSARAFPNILTALYGRTSPLTRYFPNNRVSRSNIITIENDGKAPQLVDWLSGASMIVRRQAIEEVGLLDERFFMYWEDADWCKRMWENNWKVVYYPKVSVVHRVGASSSHRKLRSSFEFHNSVYRLFGKYADPRFVVFKPLVFIALYLRFMAIALYRFIKSVICVR